MQNSLLFIWAQFVYRPGSSTSLQLWNICHNQLRSSQWSALAAALPQSLHLLMGAVKLVNIYIYIYKVGAAPCAKTKPDAFISSRALSAARIILFAASWLEKAHYSNRMWFLVIFSLSVPLCGARGAQSRCVLNSKPLLFQQRWIPSLQPTIVVREAKSSRSIPLKQTECSLSVSYSPESTRASCGILKPPRGIVFICTATLHLD